MLSVGSHHLASLFPKVFSAIPVSPLRRSDARPQGVRTDGFCPILQVAPERRPESVNHLSTPAASNFAAAGENMCKRLCKAWPDTNMPSVFFDELSIAHQPLLIVDDVVMSHAFHF